MKTNLQFLTTIYLNSLRTNLPGIYTALVLAGLLCLGGAGEVMAQQSALLDNEYTPLTSDRLNDLDVTANKFTSKDNVIDPDLNIRARWQRLAGLLTSGWVEVKDNSAVGGQVYPGGSYAGFVVDQGGLLSLTSNTTVTTFLGTDKQEEKSGGDLLTGLGGLLGSGKGRIGFETSQPFDRIRITVSISLGLGLDVSVYYAEVMKFEAADPLVCNTPTVMNRPEFPLRAYTSTTSGGSVTGAENAVDATTSNSAALNVTVAGSAALSVKDETSSYPANTYVGFDIENTSVLSLELLGNMTIRTKLDGTATGDAFSGSGQLAALDLLSSGRTRVGFVATQVFDEVEIEISSAGLNLGATLVYNAVIQCFEMGPGLTTCNEPTKLTAPDYPVYISERTGISGLLDANSKIVNAGNVIDGDANNYAELNFLATVGSEISLGVKDAITDYPAETFAGFDIENTGSLLDLAVLNSITISTYLDGTPQESTTGGNLAIGASLLSGSDRQTVGFVTTTPFDEVVITLDGGLLGASLGTTRVYGVVLKCFAEGPALACNTNTSMTESAYPVYIDMANTGVTGTLGANNNITDLSNILDDDTDNFASVTQTGGVAGTATIAVKKALSPIASETFVAFDIENPNLLGADLLFSGVSVTTYSGGTPVETISSGDLISISTSILTGTGRQKVGFIAGSSFDEVRLTIDAGLIGVDVGTTRVYGLILQEFCEGPELDCNELSILYGGSSGHPVIVNGQRTGVDAVICAGCQISNPDNAIDNNSSTAATISLVGGVGASADFSVLNAIETYSAGTFAGFDIGTPSLLGVDVLDDFTITTYLDGVQQEQKSIPSAIISASSGILINDGREVIGFATTKDFDEIQITLSKLVAADVGNFNIFSTIVQRACPGTLDCSQAYQWLAPDFPLIVEGPHTGVDGVASVVGAVLDPWNLINETTSDYAVLAAPVGILSPASISIKDQVSEYPTGTTVGFTVRSANSLVQLDLFETITLTTYNNGTQVESVSGANLINLDLLVPLLGTGGSAYNVGFVTTAPFDEVQISLSSLASGVNILDVYSPFVDKRTAVDENGDPLCPQISKEPDFNVTFVNVPVDGNANTNDDVPAGSTYGTPDAEGGNPGGATITMNSDGTYTFEASTPGIYHYLVPVCAPGEPTPCPTTRLTITVMDNSDPTANPPVANTDYGTVLSNSSIELITLANDAPGYPEASLVPGSVNITNGPSNGMASIDAGTGNITYTPNPGFVGKDSLMYEVCDDSSPSLCATAWQIYTVIPEGSPNTTIAVDDYIFIPVGSVGVGNVGINDSDPEGDSQAVTAQSITTITGVGTFELATNGEYTFTPEAGFTGPYEFIYETCDNGDPQACASATLHVLVGQTGPDLTTNIIITPSIFSGNQSFNIKIRVLELSNVPTEGTVSVYISQSSTWALNMNINDVANDWTYIGTQGPFYRFDYTQVIPGFGFAEFQVPATFNGAGSGKYVFTTSLVPGSGGETNNSNNTDQETSTYNP